MKGALDFCADRINMGLHIAMILIAGAAQAHQVVHMGLDHVAGMVGVVYLARVDHVETALYQHYGQVKFILTVLEAHGAEMSEDPVTAVYGFDLPWIYSLDDGTEIREWPLVSGSGLEHTAGIGDTLVVMLGHPLPNATEWNVVRMEPSDSLTRVLEYLAL